MKVGNQDHHMVLRKSDQAVRAAKWDRRMVVRVPDTRRKVHRTELYLNHVLFLFVLRLTKRKRKKRNARLCRLLTFRYPIQMTKLAVLARHRFCPDLVHHEYLIQEVVVGHLESKHVV
jgi:hypothetical protein